MNLQSCLKKTYDKVKQTTKKNPKNISDQSLRQQKQKKFHHLKFKSKQPQLFKSLKKENTSTGSFNSKNTKKKILCRSPEKRQQ